MSIRLAVFYHSVGGHVAHLAEHLASGASDWFAGSTGKTRRLDAHGELIRPDSLSLAAAHGRRLARITHQLRASGPDTSQ